MKPKYKLFFVLTFLGLTTANFAFAQLVRCKDNCSIGNLFQLIFNIINFLLSWAGTLAILFVVWAGVKMILANGNQEAISTAKTTLSHAIIGFFLIMISFIIVNAVVSLIFGNGLSGSGLLDAYHLLQIQ